METFQYNDNSYTYIPFNELSMKDLPDAHEYRESGYINLACSFDIETTKIDEKTTFMYMWQFGIEDNTIIGRTWDEFKELISMLHNKYTKGSKLKLLVWIQNASYEWSFMRQRFDYSWNDKHNCYNVFAIEHHKVIYFELKEHIEFRDSYILTQSPLSNYSKKYGLTRSKLVGEDILDYSLIRNKDTLLTNQELAYAINDVQVLTEWHRKYIIPEYLRKDYKIPLTATGIVRAELKRLEKDQDKATRSKMRERIQKAFPNEKMYKSMMEWLFRGGLTHSNVWWSDEELKCMDIGSFDLKSAYPAQILQRKFPYRFCKKPTTWFDKYGLDKKVLENTAYFGIFKFTNIIAKTHHSLESEHKLMKSTNAIYDNGRLRKADEIVVALTEQDMLNYDDYYHWDEIECINLYVSSKEYLPSYVRKLVLKYFQLKETLPKDSIEYGIAKAMLNSIYGMMVSGLLHRSFEVTDFGDVVLSENEEEFWKIKQKQILLPQWGIWVTAYVRRIIGSNLIKLHDDALYSDTDSIKCINTISNKYIFDAYNDKITRINKSMDVYDFDRNLFMKIGTFDYEGKSYKWKHLGAKRYIHTDIIKSEDKYILKDYVTVAGMVKGTLQNYCKENKLYIYDEFSDNLKLKKQYANKKTTSYNPSYFSVNVRDYQGNICTQEEYTSCTLNDIEFSMKVSPEYVSLINKMKNVRRIGVRRW